MRIYRKGNSTDCKFARGSIDLIGSTFHSHYEIVLVLDGEIEYISPYERQILTPLNLVVMKPGKYHQFKAHKDIDSYERCIINVEPDFFKKNNISESIIENKIYSLNKDHRIVQNFLHLKNSAQSISEEDFSAVLSAVVLDTVVSLKYCRESQHEHNESIDELAYRTMEYIDTHFTSKFDLNCLAEKLYCSISQICHKFKESYGISIKQYVLQKRMNQARYDLRNGEKAESVSIKYGFNSYSSFYRAYKKHFKMPPSKTAGDK